MAKYILKRIGLSIVTLLVLTTIVFVLVRLMPGDPFSSDKMTPEIRANMEAYYGLDKSLPEQYITYMNNLLHGDLGYSMKYVNQSVNRIIADAFPYSADLGIRALILDRKSTRLNSSHVSISYAVFCLKKKKMN